MNTQIGQIAGKIWQILGERGQVNITQVPRILNEKNTFVYQSLGWLARENKIQYTTKSGKTYVSLTPTEENTFQFLKRTRE